MNKDDLKDLPDMHQVTDAEDIEELAILPEHEPQEDEGMNTQTKYFLGAAILICAVVLLFIFRGVSTAPTAPKIPSMTYNYFQFDQIGGLWQTNVKYKNQTFTGVFRYNPEQVQDVYVSDENFTGFRHIPVYITFDPDTDPANFKYLALATTELSLHLVRALQLPVEAACTKNITDACQNRSIITCDSPGSVIYLVSKPPTQVSLKGNCVTLSGDGFELLKSVDRLLYQWYRIMR